MVWMDKGTLALLFGMMVIVNLLSTTGVFEWCAIKVPTLIIFIFYTLPSHIKWPRRKNGFGPNNQRHHGPMSPNFVNLTEEVLEVDKFW